MVRVFTVHRCAYSIEEMQNTAVSYTWTLTWRKPKVCDSGDSRQVEGKLQLSCILHRKIWATLEQFNNWGLLFVCVTIYMCICWDRGLWWCCFQGVWASHSTGKKTTTVPCPILKSKNEEFIIIEASDHLKTFACKIVLLKYWQINIDW